MDVFEIKSNLIDQLIKISKEAGQAILEVYKTNFDYQIKEDLSPLTKADTLSNNIICEGLKVITPNIPILSEENSNIPFNIRSLWKQYWLVDPLDGTKEFINKNGEFTVNIALIRDHRPVFGLIHLPVKKYTFWGCEHKGSFFLDKKNNAKKIKVSKNMNDPIRIAASRSHPSDKLTNLLNKIENYKLLKVGSSLKFCLIASGEADIYPRFGPTCEWDTAAGEAIAKFAGATVVDLNNKDLNYNSKNSYINPPFLSTSSKKLALELIKKIQNK